MHLVFFVVIFRSEGTTGTMTAVPYSAMVASGAIWVTYGFLASDATIWLPNVRTHPTILKVPHSALHQCLKFPWMKTPGWLASQYCTMILPYIADIGSYSWRVLSLHICSVRKPLYGLRSCTQIDIAYKYVSGFSPKIQLFHPKPEHLGCKSHSVKRV